MQCILCTAVFVFLTLSRISSEYRENGSRVVILSPMDFSLTLGGFVD